MFYLAQVNLRNLLSGLLNKKISEIMYKDFFFISR